MSQFQTLSDIGTVSDVSEIGTTFFRRLLYVVWISDTQLLAICTKSLVNCFYFCFQIYLMNDVLHHCARKSNEELKLSFESVAVEMFCSAWISSSHGKVATVDINLRFHFFAVSNGSKKV